MTSRTESRGPRRVPGGGRIGLTPLGRSLGALGGSGALVLSRSASTIAAEVEGPPPWPLPWPPPWPPDGPARACPRSVRPRPQASRPASGGADAASCAGSASIALADPTLVGVATRGTRWSKPHANGGQLAVDPPISPGRVLLRQPKHQLDRARGQPRTNRPLAGVRPSATHRISMPAEQGLGPDEEASPTHSPEEPAQPGEDRSDSWLECGPHHLAAQDRDLVSEHDDFDGQFLSLVPAKPEQLQHRTTAP